MHLPRSPAAVFIFVWVATIAAYTPCVADPERQRARSQELQRIVVTDQMDRTELNKTPEQWDEVLTRDKQRRERVGQIFGEGCLVTAQDYAAAALVYQHGDVSDHHFQAYLWSKRAVELGDDSQKRMMALGIDRYLVNRGNKQLFGSQARKPPGLQCWCLEPVEPTFPESMRLAHRINTIPQALAWVDSLNVRATCAPAIECVDRQLSPSPLGTVPGLW